MGHPKFTPDTGKFTPDQAEPAPKPAVDPGTAMDTAKDFGVGVLRGGMLDWDDESYGVLKSLASRLGMTDKPYTYRQAKDEWQARKDLGQERSPYATGTGQLGGALALGAATGGAGAEAGLARLGLSAAAREGAVMAGTGAAQGLGNSRETSLGGMAKDTAVGAGTGLIVGKTLRAMGRGATGAVPAAEAAAARTRLRSVGVSEPQSTAHGGPVQAADTLRNVGTFKGVPGPATMQARVRSAIPAQEAAQAEHAQGLQNTLAHNADEQARLTDLAHAADASSMEQAPPAAGPATVPAPPATPPPVPASAQPTPITTPTAHADTLPAPVSENPTVPNPPPAPPNEGRSTLADQLQASLDARNNPGKPPTPRVSARAPQAPAPGSPMLPPAPTRTTPVEPIPAHKPFVTPEPPTTQELANAEYTGPRVLGKGLLLRNKTARPPARIRAQAPAQAAPAAPAPKPTVSPTAPSLQDLIQSRHTPTVSPTAPDLKTLIAARGAPTAPPERMPYMPQARPLGAQTQPVPTGAVAQALRERAAGLRTQPTPEELAVSGEHARATSLLSTVGGKPDPLTGELQGGTAEHLMHAGGGLPHSHTSAMVKLANAATGHRATTLHALGQEAVAASLGPTGKALGAVAPAAAQEAALLATDPKEHYVTSMTNPGYTRTYIQR